MKRVACTVLIVAILASCAPDELPEVVHAAPAQSDKDAGAQLNHEEVTPDWTAPALPWLHTPGCCIGI